MRLAVPFFVLVVTSSALAQDDVTADPAGEVSADGTSPNPTGNEEELARARDLFQRGVEHAAEGQFEQAEQRFRAALEIVDAPAAHYNLASALFEQGKNLEAYSEALSVTEADDAPEELRERAEDIAGRIRQRIAFIRIDLGGEADGAQIDGSAVEDADFGRPIAVEPGAHEVVGLHDGEVVSRRNLDLLPGTQALIDVSVIPSPTEAAATVVPVAPAATVQPEEPKKRTGLWVGLAVGGAVLVAAVVVLAVLLTREPDIEDPINGDFEPGLIRW